MKKVRGLSLLLILCIVFSASSTAYAAFDVSSYSDDELLSIASACSGELYSRNHKENVLVDLYGVKILFDSFGYKYYDFSDSLYFHINIAIINSTDEEVSVKVKDAYIDGWQELIENTVSAEAHRNSRDDFISGLHQTNIKSVEELLAIKTVELVLKISIGKDKYETTVLLTDTSSFVVQD